jgi:DNA-directed RNA polymerase specialized sigma24 family protein
MHATIDEIIDTYAGLSDDDLIALRKAARCHMGGTRFSEPCDLIHEALNALIGGDRRWPKHVDFSRFMFETMRSVAHAERKRMENKLDCGRSVEELTEVGEWRLPRSKSVEAELEEREPGKLAAQAAEQARESLAHDRFAQLVIDAMLAGLEPREACDEFGWDMNEYRAARQRALIRIRKNLPPGLS